MNLTYWYAVGMLGARCLSALGYEILGNSDKFIELLIDILVLAPLLGRVFGWW